LIFYDTKVTVMNRVLNATVQRTADHAAPEITLDPLEIVGGRLSIFVLSRLLNRTLCQTFWTLPLFPTGEIRSSENTYYCQAARQLHFLWQVCKELQSSALSLLLPCPSAAANRNKGKYILTPCPISYAEEQLLHFFGQLLGIAIRADVPLPLDLLGSFWKGLVGQPLDPEQDLQEADVLTYNYVKKFENVRRAVTDESELEALCAEISSQHHSGESPDSPSRPCCSFTYFTMAGEEVELCQGGHSLIAHTMYQVGLMETDQHIEFFWTALEMFTQEELCKFIKFACNQERIPFTCPCKDGGPDTAHVPPYPMKIAPPDGAAGQPDSRYIRVETCMFMVKLPQYTSLDVMLEKLRYAIHYREDPLSG
ncbi:putative E3 ubiquitin-protein ligase HTD4, partial [Goodea atripinnis]